MELHSPAVCLSQQPWHDQDAIVNSMPMGSAICLSSVLSAVASCLTGTYTVFSICCELPLPEAETHNASSVRCRELPDEHRYAPTEHCCDLCDKHVYHDLSMTCYDIMETISDRLHEPQLDGPDQRLAFSVRCRELPDEHQHAPTEHCCDLCDKHVYHDLSMTCYDLSGLLS